MNLIDKLKVFCIRSEKLCEKTDLHCVFQTGFHQSSGVNYHMASCNKTCNFLLYKQILL